MKSWMFKQGLLGLMCACLLLGCYTVPETGRSSVQFLPEAVLAGQAAAAFDGLKEEAKVSTHQPYIDRVTRVGKRIVRAVGSDANLPPANQWEFIVFEDDDMINAFAMPGGKVGVYTGILKLAKTDDELAVIIGHEIAHVAARHGNERMSQALIMAGVGAGVAYGVKDQDEDTKKAVLLAYGVGSKLGVQLPYSRLHENESDRIGLLYMARAGYDPRAAPRFWEAMKAASKGAPPEILSTHPAHDTRIQNLRNQLPEAMLAYEKAIGYTH